MTSCGHFHPALQSGTISNISSFLPCVRVSGRPIHPTCRTPSAALFGTSNKGKEWVGINSLWMRGISQEGALKGPLNRGSCFRKVNDCQRISATGEGGGSGSPEPKDEAKVLMNKIESYLGSIFATPLWYAVLVLTIALFGGFYVYLLINYADFSDIPILNGPQGIR